MDRPRVNRRRTTPALIRWLLLVLCAAFPWQVVLAADPAAVVSLIEQAQAKQEQARQKGHAWSVTGDYVAESRALLDAGKTDQAEAAARRALNAADASLKQAAAEANAWQSRVPGL